MLITADDFSKVHDLLVAFSVRDIQVANALFKWLQFNSVSIERFDQFMVVWSEINRLKTVGYFKAPVTAEDSRHIKQIERSIENKNVRSFVRKMRWNVTDAAPAQMRRRN